MVNLLIYAASVSSKFKVILRKEDNIEFSASQTHTNLFMESINYGYHSGVQQVLQTLQNLKDPGLEMSNITFCSVLADLPCLALEKPAEVYARLTFL